MMPDRKVLPKAKSQKREFRDPLIVVKQAVQMGIQDVIVGVSGGMDSVVVLDLCVKHFKTVRPYFMYVVPGMSFQQRYLQYLERRYGVSITQVPHWLLARVMQSGVLRHPTAASASLRKCRPSHFDVWIRKKLGAHWIVTGEKACDSLERNTQVMQLGGVHEKRGKILPIAYWRHHDVQSYLARNQILMPPDYRLNASNDPVLRRKRGASFGGLIAMNEIVQIANELPEDYERIKAYFPFCDVQIQRWKQLREKGLV